MSDAAGRPGPLAGLRVLDLGRVLAAPWATQLLGDMGADVIKIERPGTGDDARYYGPHSITDAEGKATPNAAMFVCANRNKRSIAIDMATTEGQAVMHALIAKSDVLVENFIPGTLTKYGLDYEGARRSNSAIIYCSLTGYGQTGPDRQRPGYDAVFQASSGMMAITGMPDSQPGGGPMKTGPSLVDVSTGLYAASAILAALYHRQKTGEGQSIDVTLAETAVAIQTSHVQNYLLSGEQPERLGNEGNGGHPARNFTCRDGVIYISAGNNKHFVALCDVLGQPALAEDARFAGMNDRLTRRGELNLLLEPLIADWPSFALETALVAVGVPCAVIRSYDQVFADPHIMARGVLKEQPHPAAGTGTVKTVGSPIHYSATPLSYGLAPPVLGADSHAVLTDLLGLSAEDIAELMAAGVVG